MRPMANRASFLGFTGWMCVVGGLRKEINWRKVGKIWQTMSVGFRFRRSKPDPDPKSLKEKVRSKMWGK